MNAILMLQPTDLLCLLQIDPRAHVRLVDAYGGDIVRAAHHLATAKAIVSGTGTVPTPAEMHAAATVLVVRVEAAYGEMIAGQVPSQRVLVGDAVHMGLQVIGAPESDD